MAKSDKQQKAEWGCWLWQLRGLWGLVEMMEKEAEEATDIHHDKLEDLDTCIERLQSLRDKLADSVTTKTG